MLYKNNAAKKAPFCIRLQRYNYFLTWQNIWRTISDIIHKKNKNGNPNQWGCRL